MRSAPCSTCPRVRCSSAPRSAGIQAVIARTTQRHVTDPTTSGALSRAGGFNTAPSHPEAHRAQPTPIAAPAPENHPDDVRKIRLAPLRRTKGGRHGDTSPPGFEFRQSRDGSSRRGSAWSFRLHGPLRRSPYRFHPALAAAELRPNPVTATPGAPPVCVYWTRTFGIESILVLRLCNSR